MSIINMLHLNPFKPNFFFNHRSQFFTKSTLALKS